VTAAAAMKPALLLPKAAVLPPVVPIQWPVMRVNYTFGTYVAETLCVPYHPNCRCVIANIQLPYYHEEVVIYRAA
jgi:hypothetical protein